MKNSLRAFIFLFVAFISVSPVFSATWDGGGTDNLASTSANWTGDVLPATADSLFFYSTSKNCTWDITGTYSALAIDGGYTGAVTLTSMLTLSGASAPPAEPSATTNQVSNNIGTTATLNATVNPKGAETSVSFEWGPETSYGNTTSTQVIPAGTTDVAVFADITGLSPNTTYHYRTKALNSIGTTYGSDVSFTTPVIAPSATTNSVSNNTTGNSATLNGTINPNGAETSVYFQWGADTSYGNITSTQVIPSGVNNVAVTANITGLTLNTPFHYRVVATNSVGTSYGEDVTFTTPSDAPPFAITEPATNKNGNSATLNATVNPNGLQTSVYFEWGLTTGYGNTTSAQLLPADYNDVYVASNITGLSINTTYHYRIVATNGDGTTYGSDMIFTTPPITIAITSPSDGNTIYRPDVMVTGNLVTTTGIETGVTVNGIVGMVYNNQFVVNHVPLTDGVNTISVTATDTAGNTATTAITVTVNTSYSYVTLTANTESGVSPLTVNFTASTAIPNAVTTYKIDYDGNGTDDYTGSTFTDISHTYSTPGIYYAKLTVVDSAQISYTDTIAIVVVNSTDLDALLKAKWLTMKNYLANQDITSALNYYTPETKQIYNDIYTALFNQLPQTAQEMNDIQLIYAKNNTAKYRLRESELYGGTIETITYYIYFVIDTDGIWKIYRY